MPSHNAFISVTLAQTQPTPAQDPDAALGQRMGAIVIVCLLAALVVAAISKSSKGKKK